MALGSSQAPGLQACHACHQGPGSQTLGPGFSSGVCAVTPSHQTIRLDRQTDPTFTDQGAKNTMEEWANPGVSRSARKNGLTTTQRPRTAKTDTTQRPTPSHTDNARWTLLKTEPGRADEFCAADSKSGCKEQTQRQPED